MSLSIQPFCRPLLACIMLAQPVWANAAENTLKLADSLNSLSFSLTTAEPVYQQALASSRSGNPDAAMLWQSALTQPQLPLRYLFDYVTTLTWAGRDQEALLWMEQLTARRDTPAYVLEALASAARNLKHYSLAETLYRQVLANAPARWESQLGLVYSLADGNAYASALTAGKSLTMQYPDKPDSWRAYGYATGRAQEYTVALYAYQRLTELAPNDREGWRGHVQVLRMLGAYHEAGSLAAAHPGVLTQAESAALQADTTAVLIRWGAADEDKPILRFLHTDMALKESDQLLTNPPPAQTTLINDQIRYDRVVALTNRRRSAEAVALYETLLHEGKAVPDYARATAAASYLELKQPEQARDLYRELITRDPKNAAYRWGLFHALVDCESYTEAQEVIDRLAEETPLRIHTYSPLMARDNPAYLESRQDAAMARAYADQLDEAQRRLEALLLRAPGNSGTRALLSHIERWRGWPRRALDDADLALNIDDKDKEAHLAAQGAALSRQDWQRAQTETHWLLTNYPEDRTVRETATLNALHDKPELVLESTWDAGGEASHSFVMRGKLYSAPLAWDTPRSWRLFASFARADASFQGGNGFRQWMGAGLDYAWRDWSAELELRQAVKPSRKGLAGSLAYAPDDHWTFKAVAETDTTDLPSKGLNQNLTASKYSTSVTWCRDEVRQIGTTLSWQDFNDGNKRTDWSANWRERWVNQPRFKLYTEANFSYSQNSLNDAVYFNPAHATGTELTVIGEWLGFRRFERSMWHRVVAGAGSYAQAGFGAMPVTSLKYEQDWTLDHATSFTWGIGLRRHPYDGNEETARYLDLRLNWRF
ncbi:poly-beta-1,6 N-acetyl-D-glucosamine export porin PgaA [Sulfurirhabdus autotrophica]|uniref:poly-beta-1,6 N-acetyl-D-glucosamine export porin PgaA n=1 Tax=Sulfurirhabdus autotrophica TaxID=1706046 RepID=UPI00140426B7|nr:poly-beta-1,6 N-acetyl-D-glucosamine export porin PgaA [Sulfurirhabdus autotrophica]